MSSPIPMSSPALICISVFTISSSIFGIPYGKLYVGWTGFLLHLMVLHFTASFI